MKIKNRSLYLGVVYLLAIALCVFSCEKFTGRERSISVSEEYAFKKAKEFCEGFNIRCDGINKSEVRKGLGHPGGPLFWMFQREYSRLHLLDDYFRGIKLYFNQDSHNDAQSDYILFIVPEKSKEVDIYENEALYEFYRKKYWSVKLGKAIWPEFLTEEKAKSIFHSISNKLKIPSDMALEKIEINEDINEQKNGLWSAVWLRKRNGYKYEGDAISISIMGATGEFVAYVKTYRGVPTSTEMRISREQAVEIGWKRFKKYRTWKMKGLGDKAKDLYEISAEPLIIQSGPFGQAFKPIEIEGSKLAWIVKFKFTGGFENPRNNIPHFRLTEEESKAFHAYHEAMEKKWREFGTPERDFEIRIDAATGRVLYASPVWPWYMRWFREWTIKQ